MTETMPELSREQIRQTAALIAPYIRRTPVIDVDAADLGLSGLPVRLKLELFQHTGSFKPRGAFTSLLTREIPAAGVVAASGGNHGAAVAYAAQKLGIPATIFIPSAASQTKVERIRDYGATLVIAGERYDDALVASEIHIAQTGALAVHAFDQTETLLGQGTVALEFAEQAPDVDTVLVAVGGGGLIGGMAAWYRGETTIIGVEPYAAPTLFDALAAGAPVNAPAGGLAADSLAPRRVGELMFPLAQAYVDQVALVSDDAIRDAQERLWKTLRIVAEPGGAAALAALISGAYVAAPDERVGVLVCGGNTAAVNFTKGS